VPWWRALSAGLSIERPILPMRLGLAVFLAELSTRPINELGHAGFMLRFDYPLSTTLVGKH
jgi:hypothetical protein